MIFEKLALALESFAGDGGSNDVDVDDNGVEGESTELPLELPLEREDCADGYVQCDDGVTCIHETYQCDRFLDCPDKSDEHPDCGVYTTSRFDAIRFK